MDITQYIPQLGTTGFAIWIIWKMYDTSQKILREKDLELIAEIGKRDKRNDDSQNIFHEYADKTQATMTKHITDNTKALADFTISVKENTAVTKILSQHLAEHHPAAVTVNNIK